VFQAIEGYAARSREGVTVQFNQVSDGYVETLGIAMITGRDFNSHDTATSPRVAMINRRWY
jgi:hypothetical protein